MSNEDIRARLEAATVGPWTCRKQRWGKEERFKVQSEAEDLAIIAVTLYEDQQEANGDFMAHAPTDIEELLAKLDAVESMAREHRPFSALCSLPDVILAKLEGE